MWNPHIIKNLNDPKQVMDKAHIIYDDSKKSLLEKMEHIVSTEKMARELLMAVPGIGKICDPGEGGIPLCYVLKPVTEKIKKDSISIAKIGGLPNLVGQVIYARDTAKHDKKKAPSTRSVLERVWPKCGCCGQRMRFVGQYDITGWNAAIHGLTADITPKKHDWMNRPDSWHSGLGYRRTGGMEYFGMHNTFWQFFFCADSATHFHNPNMDAHILIHNIYVDKEISGHKNGDLIWKTKPEKKEDYTDIINEIIAFVEEMPNNRSCATPFTLRAIKSLELRWELDFKGYWDDKLQDKVEKVMKDNPEIFTDYSPNFSLFGRPHSQQTERRPFCQLGYGGEFYDQPKRMAPMIHWHDEGHDITYQIYADLECVEYENVFAKIDASNT